MENKNKIILIGFRATGKSTVGRLLARQLGFRFLDLDQEIVRQEGQSIEEMVARHDWEYFRRLERRILAGLADKDRLVVATGGGAVLHRDLWPELAASSLVVWLFAPQATIAARLAADQENAGQRPSLTGQGLIEEVQQVLAERTPLYQSLAQLRIDTSVLSPAAAAQQIAQAFARAALPPAPAGQHHP